MSRASGEGPAWGTVPSGTANPEPALLYAPLTRHNLREQAYVLIKTAITTGTLQEGAVYPVKFFAGRFGVSRTPVREALLDLAKQGFVEALPNRGFRVAPASDKDQDDIAQVREMLEVPAMGRLARCITPEAIVCARRLCEDTIRAARRKDLAGFLEADRVFHLYLIDQLGNDQLTRIVAELRERMRLLGMPQLAANGRLLEVGADHVPLVEALADHDQARAEDVMRRHLKHLRSDWAGRQPQLTSVHDEGDRSISQ
jgi:DNA-binding GntR family transcriptional regulator